VPSLSPEAGILMPAFMLFEAVAGAALRSMDGGNAGLRQT
jgi:hypothetical protein